MLEVCKAVALSENDSAILDNGDRHSGNAALLNLRMDEFVYSGCDRELGRTGCEKHQEGRASDKAESKMVLTCASCRNHPKTPFAGRYFGKVKISSRSAK